MQAIYSWCCTKFTHYWKVRSEQWIHTSSCQMYANVLKIFALLIYSYIGIVAIFIHWLGYGKVSIKFYATVDYVYIMTGTLLLTHLKYSWVLTLLLICIHVSVFVIFVLCVIDIYACWCGMQLLFGGRIALVYP